MIQMLAFLAVFSVDSLQAPIAKAAMEPEEIITRLALKECVPSHPMYCKKNNIRYNRRNKNNADR